MSIALTRFARTRLFEPPDGAPRIPGVTPEEFVEHCNAHTPLEDREGYAPFCRLHVHRNWTAAPCAAVEITPDNERFLRSGYEARAEGELPVLTRWFEGIEAPVAAYLQVILYSAEQLRREQDPVDADWGIVGCLATGDRVEPPMAPITMLRNALGVEEGGSGVPLDREAYLRSVDYWSRHANVRTPTGSAR